ncbi:MAG: 2-amino-4-hydroxy-6-hydroxymethyldihydropteridine diphosphokinase [Polyangiaceae bacterium]
MDHIRRVVVGLGSNIGDRRKNLELAVERLRVIDDLHVAEVSEFYETSPEGGPQQDPYFNGAVLLLTAMDGAELLAHLQRIEAELGRVRTVANAPRTIDLDILWIEGENLALPNLVVPHPRLKSRPFMMRPLLDLAPDAFDAATGEQFSETPTAAIELTPAPR